MMMSFKWAVISNLSSLTGANGLYLSLFTEIPSNIVELYISVPLKECILPIFVYIQV